MNLNFKHAISFVWSRDVYKTLSFYEDVLGFKRVFDSDGWIEMAVPGLSNTYIAINKWEKEETYPINEFITLGVENIESFKRHLEDKGVSLKNNIVKLEEDGLKMLKFYDPDKNIITVSEIQN